VKKVKFLGVVIKSKRIKIEEEKIKKEKVKGVINIQKFLKLVNYYYQFIKDFTIIARPLHNIIKKDQK